MEAPTFLFRLRKAGGAALAAAPPTCKWTQEPADGLLTLLACVPRESKNTVLSQANNLHLVLKTLAVRKPGHPRVKKSHGHLEVT